MIQRQHTNGPLAGNPRNWALSTAFLLAALGGCIQVGSGEEPTPADGQCTEPLCDAPIDQRQLPVCAEIASDRSHTPVDIIWMVDSSNSMVWEARWVGPNILSFFDLMQSFNLNLRIILLGGPFIEIPAAVNATEQRVVHVDDHIGSSDTLEKMISWYPRYREFLRPHSARLVIVTTDDNSAISADEFQLRLAQLGDPAFTPQTIINGIISTGNHFRGCETGAAEGHVYTKLAARTGGFTFPICDADWTQIFNTLARQLTGLVGVGCSHPFPNSISEQEVYSVTVRAAAPGAPLTAPFIEIEGSTQCAAQSGQAFWLIEDSKQRRVEICTEACTSFDVARVKLEFHCSADVN